MESCLYCFLSILKKNIVAWETFDAVIAWEYDKLFPTVSREVVGHHKAWTTRGHHKINHIVSAVYYDKKPSCAVAIEWQYSLFSYKRKLGSYVL